MPVISISGYPAVVEYCPPNALCVPIEFRVQRTGPGLDQPLTVYLRYQGSAAPGIDYEQLPSQVTIEAGRDSATVLSLPIDDTFFEGDETIIAEIAESPGLPGDRTATYGIDPARRQATTIIRDNEDGRVRPVVSLELVDGNAAETRIDQNNIDWAEFRVRRTGDATGELLVFLNTRQGSARLGEDYRLDGVNNGTVRFAPGQGVVTVRLYPIDDDFYEGDETVFFHLIAPPYANPLPDPYEIDFAHSSVSMVIHDNDPVTTRLEITAPREGQHFEAGSVIELRAQIIGPGSDQPWTIEFFDGDRSIGTTQPNVALWWRNAIGGPHVINARVITPAAVVLQARPVNITVGPGPALPVVSIIAPHPGKTMEPHPGAPVVASGWIISRTGPTDASLTVHLKYDGTATPDLDYRELPRQVVLPAGSPSTVLVLEALDDLLAEGPEIVRATVIPPEIGPPGYVISAQAGEAMFVIGDDEAGAPQIRLDIVKPVDGAQFPAGAPIKISAMGVWTEGEIDRPVAFFAGTTFIGQSTVVPALRPTVPCLPSVHTIFWQNAPPGHHVLTARFERAPGVAVTSPPVHITVGSDPPGPVVRIAATSRFAEEDSSPLDRLPLRGEFTISRNAATSQSLSVFVHYSGTATPEVDYPRLPMLVTIPAGATSTRLEVVPVNDSLAEGVETVIATLSHCPPRTDPPLGMPCVGGFTIDPAGARATVFIHDQAALASVVITHPSDGARFNPGETIPIRATAIDPSGFIDLVEFWDGDQRIGTSSIVHIPEIPPGTPSHHVFEWRAASNGPHVLTARAPRPGGTSVISAPVRITVGAEGNLPPEVVITRPTNGAEFPLDRAIEIGVRARDPDGFVRLLEFFANGRKIGESSIGVVPAPEPGREQTFTLVWHAPTIGTHVLTARATDNAGASRLSAAVEVRVAMSDELPVVTAVAPDPLAIEPRAGADLNTATFRLRREGPVDNPLVVAYSLQGSAANGVDYERLPAFATIPAGARSVPIVVRPLADDLREGFETVLLRVIPPPPTADPVNLYRIGRRSLAVAVISDELPVLHADRAECMLMPGNLLHVCFPAEPGRNYRVEASSDLRNWETLTEGVSSDGTWHFVDCEMANHPQRFYRLAPEPMPAFEE